MIQLTSASWPPAPIRTARLVLRESEPRDRAGFIELFSSPEVGAHVGGARSRDQLERDVPEVPGRRPGCFVVEADGTMIGIVTLDRRAPTRAGGADIAGEATELGYMLLPQAWGRGYATEACRAALEWFGSESPEETVILTAQTTNAASVRVAEKLGFVEVDRFEEYGTEQWFGVLRASGRDA